MSSQMTALALPRQRHAIKKLKIALAFAYLQGRKKITPQDILAIQSFRI
jgi:hypothetical protein